MSPFKPRGDLQGNADVKRQLLRSTAFVRAAKRIAGKNPGLLNDIEAALELLCEDAFHPRLKAHRLSGILSGSWACSAGHDLRSLFEFVQYQDSEAILLSTTGTHDDVY